MWVCVRAGGQVFAVDAEVRRKDSLLDQSARKHSWLQLHHLGVAGGPLQKMIPWLDRGARCCDVANDDAHVVVTVASTTAHQHANCVKPTFRCAVMAAGFVPSLVAVVICCANFVYMVSVTPRYVACICLFSLCASSCLSLQPATSCEPSTSTAPQSTSSIAFTTAAGSLTVHCKRSPMKYVCVRACVCGCACMRMRVCVGGSV